MNQREPKVVQSILAHGQSDHRCSGAAQTGTLCIILPGAQPYLTNVTTTLVDASGNSLAGNSEAALQAAFLAIDQTLFANFRTQGKLGGVVKIPPAYGTTPINNEVWDVDANTGINVALSNIGVNAGPLPAGTLVSVTWPDGTTAQFIRTNSVPSLSWKYVPGTMKDKNGNPITPVSGTMIKNPNTGGSGGGSTVPYTNPPWLTTIHGEGTCQSSVTWYDGQSTYYVYVTFLPC